MKEEGKVRSIRRKEVRKFKLRKGKKRGRYKYEVRKYKEREAEGP